MKLTPKARRVLQERRYENRQWAIHSRHVREIAWFGSEGDRCYGCKEVPMHSWEHPDPEQRDWLWHMLDREQTRGLASYVRYVASVRHERRMAS